MPHRWRTVAWGDWDTGAFSRAFEQQRPVALLVETAWSAPCARFRHDLEADSGTRAVLEARYVPVRVDADERPDIADRYTARGWPTFVALTPHGWPLAPISTADAAACAADLATVAAAFHERRDELLRRVIRAAATPDAPAPPDPVVVIEGWLDAWTRELPLDATAWRALSTAAEVAEHAFRPDLVDRAEALVDRLAVSPLRDEETGLWFRAAPGQASGWEPVQGLDDQSAWIQLESAVLAHQPSAPRRERLVRVIRSVERAFGTPAGYRAARFSLAHGAGAARDAFTDTYEHDDRIFVEVQARLLAALMRAGVVVGMHDWVARAVDRLDDLVARAYRRDGGVAHVLDPGPRVRGLLADQVAVASALLDAWSVADRTAYLDAADELLASTVRKFHDPATGALRDRVPSTAGAGDVGLLGHPHHPADANALAASCLLRLAGARDTDAPRATAHALLEATLASWDPADPAHAPLLALVR